jgi:hypothetical protein
VDGKEEMTNWKTTAIGVGLAVLQALQTYHGANNWQGYAYALGIAAFGFLAKDFNVTGGTKQQ